MEILAMGDNWGLDRMEPFWDNEYIELDYVQEKFNNPDDLKLWKDQGYVHPDSHYTGAMCDMRSLQPTWNDEIVSWFYKKYNVNDIGTSYYRMGTGVVLPMHGDIYTRYRKMFRCELHNIKRIVVFLEDWHSGHYFEIAGNPVTYWKAGDYVWWFGDVKHMAANIGLEDRYTLQITGHLR